MRTTIATKRDAVSQAPGAQTPAFEGAAADEAALGQSAELRGGRPGQTGGQSAELRGGAAGAAGAAQTGEGPATTGDNPTVPAGQTHADATVDGAFNGPQPDYAAPIRREKRMNVRVLHGAADPLVGTNVPAEEQLYEKVESTGRNRPQGTSAIRALLGMPAKPAQTTATPATDALYIGGGPSIDDIHQGGLGDCYFLASITSIVQSDAGRIAKMLQPAGANVNVTFHKYDGSNWVPVQVTVDRTVAQSEYAAGRTSGRPQFTGVRAGEAPKESKYWAEVEGSSLSFKAAHVYELALWAPLLEKAYAVFAQQYGQYGGYQPGSAAAQQDAAGNQRSGYDIIGGGGIAHYMFPLIYGANATDFRQTDSTYDPAANNVTANIPTLQNLLRVMGAGVPQGQAFHMTAGVGRDTAVQRLKQHIGTALAAPDIDAQAALKADLQALLPLIETWSAATGPARDTALSAVGRAAAQLVAPGKHAVLHDGGAPAVYQQLLEVGCIVGNITTDASAGQRHTYAWHSYSVLGATFVDAEGKEMQLTPSNVSRQADKIDAGKSTVRLRNPHGTNEPDAHGRGPADGKDDGRFQLTLDQFFRAFQFQQTALVRV